jgi:L-seryl-tRNA(Ser) seleniumtransferase
MIRTPLSDVEQRARQLAKALENGVPDLKVDVAPSVARGGGGTLPTYEIPSFAVRLEGTDADTLAAGLRSGDPPVIGRVREGMFWVDLRTLLPGEEGAVIGAVRRVVG